MPSTGTTAVLAVPERPTTERAEAREAGDAEGRFAGLMAQFVQPAPPPDRAPAGAESSRADANCTESTSIEAPAPRSPAQAPATGSRLPAEAPTAETPGTRTPETTLATATPVSPGPGVAAALAEPLALVQPTPAPAALPAEPSNRATHPAPATIATVAEPGVVQPASGGVLPGLSAVLAVNAPPAPAPSAESRPEAPATALDQAPNPAPIRASKAEAPALPSAPSASIDSRAQVTFTLAAASQPVVPSLRAADLRSSRAPAQVLDQAPAPERAVESPEPAVRPEAPAQTEITALRPEGLPVLPPPTLLQAPPGTQAMTALAAPAPPLQMQLSGAAPAAPQAPAAVPIAPPVTQVEGGIRWMLKGGTQEARLQLHPEALGQVTIHLKVEGGEVHARLWLTEPASVQAVQEGRPHLEQALKDQGLLLGSFDLQQGHRPFQEAPSAPAYRDGTPSPVAAARQEAPAAPALSILNAHHVELYA